MNAVVTAPTCRLRLVCVGAVVHFAVQLPAPVPAAVALTNHWLASGSFVPVVPTVHAPLAPVYAAAVLPWLQPVPKSSVQNTCALALNVNSVHSRGNMFFIWIGDCGQI